MKILALVVQFIAQSPRRLWPMGTWANRPNAATFPFAFYFVTDIAGGALFRSNGTRWVPVSGRLTVRTINTDVSTTATTAEVALDSWTAPAGLFDENAALTVEIRPQTSANTNAKRLRIRGDGTGTNGFELSLINANSATGVSGFYIFGCCLRNSLTSLLGNAAGTTGQSATAYQAPSIDMTHPISFYVTAQKDVAGDTVTFKSIKYIYEKGVPV